MRSLNIGFAARFSSLLVLLLLLGSSYLWLIRPAQLRWGATNDELARSMPEDSIVPHPIFDATRAITIHGRPEDIWPWLIQMGFGRAGFYGCDLIENVGSGAGIRSADEIIPAFQHPRQGDPLPLSVAATLAYGPVLENHYVVWISGDAPTHGVFIWQLFPVDASHTRLISRIRWNYLRTPQGIALGVFTEFADHVAVRKILTGIRDRVEGRPPQTILTQALEISGWTFATVNFLIAIFLTLFWRYWYYAWVMALCAGALLQFVLYSRSPVVLCAFLPSLFLALMLLIISSLGRRHKAQLADRINSGPYVVSHTSVVSH